MSLRMMKLREGLPGRCLRALVTGLALASPAGVMAAFVVPSALTGSVTYGYNYISGGGSAAETSSISAGVGTSLYIWQPWFITGSVGLSVGLSRSATTNDTASTSTIWGGGFGLQLFPQSRFPFSLNVDVTDNLLATSQTLDDFSYRMRSTRITAAQSYYGRQGFLVNAVWSGTESKTDDVTSQADLWSLNAQWRFTDHSMAFNGTRTEITDDKFDRTPVTSLLSLTDDYRPAQEFNVNTRVSRVNTSTTGGGFSSETAVDQLASIFSWRPEYRPFTLGGGVVLASSAGEDSGVTISESRTLATNLSLGYAISRRMRASAALSLSSSDTAGVQTTQSSESLSLNYSSDNYALGPWSYIWSAGATASNSDSDGTDELSSQQSLGGNFSHGISRVEMFGASSTRLSLSQGIGSFSSSSQDELGYSLSHGANGGWTGRTGNGVTDLNVSLSDSRSYGDTDTDSQFFTVQGVRSQNINRLSSMDANVTFQASRQSGDGGEEDGISRSLSAGVNYSHSRAFGINPLRYSSRLTYSRNLSSDEDNYDNIDWGNRFDYYVGLLNMSLDVRLYRASGNDVAGILNFRATRQF